MQYRKIIKMVACMAALLFLVCFLSGCSASFAGFPVGGREEFHFVCDESDTSKGREEEEPEEPPEEPSRESAEPPEEPSRESGLLSEELPDEPVREAAVSDGKVDLNTAGLEELMTLNGIGETRARAIIDYRTRQGAFTAIEDIMQIPGIKEGIFSKIKDGIVVR